MKVNERELTEKQAEVAEPSFEVLVDRLDRLWSAQQRTAATGTNGLLCAGTRIDKYTIERCVGQGSFGIVYLARDTELARDVALKFPRIEVLLDAEKRRRFHREAVAAAAFDHPLIVPTYEARLDGPLPFIATAYCAGPDLSAWLAQRDEAVAPRDAAGLVAQLADALQFAHDRGIVHRDIKPSNILLTAKDGIQPDRAELRDLVPRLTDFGLAKLCEASLEETRASVLIGTPLYMAPEQIGPTNGVVGPATDIHALGVVLYELLCGQTPFNGESYYEVLDHIRASEPPRPSRLRPDVPRDLDVVCLKCLSKTARERYATAADLAADLRRYQSDLPIHARPASLVNRVGKWSRRHVAAVWTMMFVFLAMSMVLAVSQLLIGRANLELKGAVGREKAAAEKAQTAEHQSGDLLFAADVRLAGEALANNNMAEVRERLTRHLPGNGNPDRRGFAWHYLWSQLQQEDLTLTGHDWAFDVEYSPDGSILASSHESGEVVLYAARSGQKLRILADLKGVIRKIDFSPDGRLLAGISDQGQVCVWRVKNGNVHTLFTAHEPGPGDLAFHPDGIQLATAANLEVKVHRLPNADERENSTSTHETITTLGPMRGIVYSVDISLDGKWLAFGGGYNTLDHSGCLRVWNLITQTLHYEHLFEFRVDSVRFAGAESVLTIATSNGVLTLIDAARRKEIRAWVAHPDSRLYDVAYAKRGQLITGAKDSTVRLWDLHSGTLKRLIQGHSERVCGVAACTTTGQIATASKDGAVKVWQPLGQAFSKRRLPNNEPVNIKLPVALANGRLLPEHARFAPDNRTLIATSNFSGHVVRHDLVRATHKEWGVFDLWAGRIAWAQNAERFALSGKKVVARDDALGDGIGANQNCAVVVYDASTLRIEQRIRAFSGEATCAAIAPDGKHLAVAEADHTIRIWELPSGRLLHTVPDEGLAVWDITYSPDGRFLMGAVGDDLRIWSSQDFTLKHAFKQHDNTITRVVASDDSRLAATVSHDKSVRLWSLNEGRHLYTLTGHTTLPASAAFSKDGRSLATGADGGAVHIWDVVTGQQLIVLRDVVGQNSVRIRDLTFSDEGSLIAAVTTEEPPGFFLAEWCAKSATAATD